MAEYRCYFLCPGGHINAAESFEAPDDEDALLRGLALSKQGAASAVEIWEAARIVSCLCPLPEGEKA